MMSRYDKGKEGSSAAGYGPSSLTAPIIVVKKRKKGEPEKDVTAKPSEPQEAIGFGCSITRPVRYE